MLYLCKDVIVFIRWIFRCWINIISVEYLRDETIHKINIQNAQIMSEGEIDIFDRYHPPVAHHRIGSVVYIYRCLDIQSEWNGQVVQLQTSSSYLLAACHLWLDCTQLSTKILFLGLKLYDTVHTRGRNSEPSWWFVWPWAIFVDEFMHVYKCTTEQHISTAMSAVERGVWATARTDNTRLVGQVNRAFILC